MDITIDDNRNVYVVSDIHNYADGFKRLLKKIQFNENDLLIMMEIYLTVEISLLSCILKY